MEKCRYEEERPQFNHSINVTPFIDVILVLLIVFMVAAPLATGSVAVQLPSAAAAPQADNKAVYLTLRQDKSLYLGDDALTEAELGAALARHFGAADKREARIFIRADKNADYGSVMQLLNRLRAEGYVKIGLVGLAEQA